MRSTVVYSFGEGKKLAAEGRASVLSFGIFLSSLGGFFLF